MDQKEPKSNREALGPLQGDRPIVEGKPTRRGFLRVLGGLASLISLPFLVRTCERPRTDPQSFPKEFAPPGKRLKETAWESEGVFRFGWDKPKWNSNTWGTDWLLKDATEKVYLKEAVIYGRAGHSILNLEGGLLVNCYIVGRIKFEPSARVQIMRCHFLTEEEAKEQDADLDGGSEA